MKPALYYANKEGKDDEMNYEKVGGGYNFYDLNAKITHRFDGGDRLSLSFYCGDDKAKISMEDSYTGNIISWTPDGTQVDTGRQDYSLTKAKFRWRWGGVPPLESRNLPEALSVIRSQLYPVQEQPGCQY